LAFNIRDAMEKGIRSINRTDTINLPFALLDLVQLISFHEVFAPRAVADISVLKRQASLPVE
jgi:hypothetical protein